MREEPTVQYGMPEKTRALNLLNSAYDGWGSEDLFEWKYDLYPEFDPCRHCYYIEIDGDLAAFRRVFEKDLETKYGKCTLFILGDTAVAKSYRGEGLYSKLHKVTTDYCRSNDGIISTFNRVGNVTYNANLKRGWKFQTIPLQMKIFDFSNVIGQYAQKVIQSGTRLHSILSTFDQNISFRTLDGTTVNLTEESINNDYERRFLIPIPETVLEAGIEVASDESLSQGIKKGMGRTINSTGDHSESLDLNHISADTFDLLPNEYMEEVVDLYNQSSTQFRRDRSRIEHMIHYPGSTMVLVRENNDVVGFAAVAPREQHFTTEGRVLGMKATTGDSRKKLIDEIEKVSRDNGYDVLLASSYLNIPSWVNIAKQVFMWSPDTLSESVANEISNLEIELYDVL